MPEWLLTLLIGGVIVSLIGIIYNSLTGRVSRLERWKEGRPVEVLTMSRHYELCKENSKELREFIKDEMEEVKKEIRKSNGGQ